MRKTPSSIRRPAPTTTRTRRPVQRRAAAGHDGGSHRATAFSLGDVPSRPPTADTGGQDALPPRLRAGVEALSGVSMDDVRVHRDSPEPACLGALAFAEGRDIHLAPGQEDHLPHEAWHVVQQKQGRVKPTKQLRGADLNDSAPLEQEADRMGARATAMPVAAPGEAPPPVDSAQPGGSASVAIVQRRRLPAGAELAGEVPGAGRPLMEVRGGIVRMLVRSWLGLTAQQQADARSNAKVALPKWNDRWEMRKAMLAASAEQLKALADAIVAVDPTAELGNPRLRDTGARAGTSDAANIAKLIRNANVAFDAIAANTRDTDVEQIFGVANVAAAKGKYAAAKAKAASLQAIDKIVADRSGYSDEAGLGGLSNSGQIAVEPDTIDAPDSPGAIITFIHEAMHAGNADVDDKGYIDQPSFKVAAEPVKLTNAAHFEIVPRRILSMSNAFPGEVFVPAGAVAGGVQTATLTPDEDAVQSAYEVFRKSWHATLNLHKLFAQVYRTPTDWTSIDLGPAFSGAPAGAHFADCLPFWSKVEMLTVHERTSINPAGAASEKPVLLTDLALSEGVTRSLRQGIQATPDSPANAAALLAKRGTKTEQGAWSGATVAAKRDLIIKLVFRASLGNVTGDEGRDTRAAKRLAAAKDVPNFTDMLTPKKPSDFS